MRKLGKEIIPKRKGSNEVVWGSDGVPSPEPDQDDDGRNSHAFEDSEFQIEHQDRLLRCLTMAGDKVMEQLVLDLINPGTRENALLELSKRRESFPELAPVLWHSFGTVAALIQEVVSIYPVLSPPVLSAHASNRVCNALALLQCLASHQDTRSLFLKAHVPLFLYPFLNTTSKTRPFEYLRLTSLGVIGAIVKVDDTEIINFLLTTEIIPLCLKTMEMGSELSKTVATFIVQKILLDNVGLGYVVQTAERFFAVSAVLNNMVLALPEQPSVRLLKHIIRCYLRLSDNSRAREALRQCLPKLLTDQTFTICLAEDGQTRGWLAQLLVNVGHGHSDQQFPKIMDPTACVA